jgi:hypothetical protein
MAYKHKYKIGQQVKIDGIPGVIFTLGHAATKGRKFTTCDASKEIDDPSLLGYQVHYGNKIKIIKECDIVPV